MIGRQAGRQAGMQAERHTHTEQGVIRTDKKQRKLAGNGTNRQEFRAMIGNPSCSYNRIIEPLSVVTIMAPLLHSWW